MEFPYTHHSHSSHHRREERDEEYPPPAPPSFDGPPPPQAPSYYEPPPPNVYGGGPGGPGEPYHHHSQPPPPPNYSHHGYPPQQPGYYSSSEPPVNVQHVAHEDEADRHHHRPHMPSFMHHHDQRKLSELVGKPTVRVVTKAESNFSLTIRDGQVILARSNHSDPFQHWIKDEKFSTRVKDEEGFPSFALVNKATGQAIKHSVGATQPLGLEMYSIDPTSCAVSKELQSRGIYDAIHWIAARRAHMMNSIGHVDGIHQRWVQLIDYNPDVLDESVLWTESRDLGDGHRTIRMVNNIRLNVDAFNGDKNHGGVHDGTTIVLWEWKKGDNQRWKIIPYCKDIMEFPGLEMLFCAAST
ncbi:unnamed protein product [Camellia sinensis]